MCAKGKITSWANCWKILDRFCFPAPSNTVWFVPLFYLSCGKILLTNMNTTKIKRKDEKYPDHSIWIIVVVINPTDNKLHWQDQPTQKWFPKANLIVNRPITILLVRKIFLLLCLKNIWPIHEKSQISWDEFLLFFSVKSIIPLSLYRLYARQYWIIYWNFCHGFSYYFSHCIFRFDQPRKVSGISHCCGVLDRIDFVWNYFFGSFSWNVPGIFLKNISFLFFQKFPFDNIFFYLWHYQVRRLWYDNSRKLELDNLLLVVAQTGVFIYSAFCIIGSFFEMQDHLMSFLASLATLVQTTLQTVFILDASRLDICL